MLADPRGKFARLADRSAAELAKRCPDPLPAFGVSAAGTAHARASVAVVDLVHDVLGADLGPGALAMERSEARCQQAAWRAVAECQRAHLGAFARCQAEALEAGAGSAEALAEACLGLGAPDPKGGIARKCDDAGRVAKALARRCDGLDLVALLPPCGMATDPAVCLAAHAACRSCEALAVAGGLPGDCDLFDDGVANGSCAGAVALSCVAPAQGGMLDVPDGAGLTFMGRVQGGLDVEQVSVAGLPADVAEDGTFEAPIGTAFGANFVPLEAEDALGRRFASTCGFVASDDFLAEDAFRDDAFSLKLRPPAVDDGGRSGPINSLGDLLFTVLNSSELRNRIHAALLAANPLKPDACDQTVLGVCVLRSAVIYLESQIDGPNESQLGLVAVGLATSGTVRNVRIRIRVYGHVAGISYDTQGWVTFASAATSQTLDVGLGGGTVNVVLRPGSESASVGSISTSFSGLDGAIIDIVVGLFQGTVRDLVAGLVRDYIRDSASAVFQSVLDPLAPPDAFVVVQRPVAGADIPLSIESAWSAISLDPARARFGLGTRFTAPDDHGLASLGVPLVPAPTTNDPNTSAPSLLAVEIGPLNQALHALWRGGLFHGTLTADDAPGLPAGFAAELEASLPPVARSVAGDEVAIGLAGLRALVTMPGVVDLPTPFVVGGEATADLAIVDDRLVFAEPAIDVVHLAGVDAALDAAQQASLEGAVVLVLQRLIDESLLLSSLGLGIPAFEITPEAQAYGLPAGELGILGPTLSTTHSHAHAEGSLGIR